MLIRFGCPTHGFDQDQRAIELYFEQDRDILTITPPENGYIAPTGKYMLFVSREGSDNTIFVPSVAIIVNLVES